MGGGDLNLKKSWHPSTLRNQEKVWKAEQKNDMEKKKIAELQREIIQERAREDMQKYAEDSGAVEKKDSMKLDWMYKGPGAMVNKEEYLLGRSVDKTFELTLQAEKAATSLAPKKNHVDHECLPPSIFTGGTEQVDMVRKLQEDPLYAIKKKENETRSQILKNPVKLKQLRELIAEEKSKKQKKHKKDKKRKKSKKSKRNDNSSDSDELDALLMAKYKKLKEKLQQVDIAKLENADSSDEASEQSDDDNQKHRKSGKHSKKKNKKHHVKESESSESEKKEKRKRHHEYASSEDESKPKKSYGLIKSIHHRSHTTTARSSQPKKSETKSATAESSHESGSSKSNRWVKPERKKLTEEEMEQRRLEMMDNVKWRDQERVRNVSRYRKEEKEENKETKNYSKDFLTKQLSHAASQGTVAGRIKANINNIQRSGMAMDKNFARR